MVSAVSGADIPYVVGLGILVGLTLGEGWLRRRTGQSWWAVDQLGDGIISVVLTILIIYAGHPLVALIPAAIAVTQFATARRNWVKRSRDLMERNRLELEHPGAASVRTAEMSGRLGLRGWIFVSVVAGVWTLLAYHWGFSWFTAGLVAAVIGIVIVRPSRGRSSKPPVPRSPEPFRYDEGAFDTRAVPPFANDGEHARDGMPPGHGFELTLSGRPARLLGWLFARLVRTPEAPDRQPPQ